MRKLSKEEIQHDHVMLAVIRWNEKKQQEALLGDNCGFVGRTQYVGTVDHPNMTVRMYLPLGVPDVESARRYKRNQVSAFNRSWAANTTEVPA